MGQVDVVIRVLRFSDDRTFFSRLGKVYGKSGLIVQKSPSSVLQLEQGNFTGLGCGCGSGINIIGFFVPLSKVFFTLLF